MATLCAMCSRPGDLRCVRCRGISYCSKDCQRLDWSLHKLLCSKFMSGFQDSNRPHPRAYRGIFFPDNEDEPRFIWLTFRRNQVGLWEVNDLTSIFDPTDFRLHIAVDESAVLKRPVGKRIMNGQRSLQRSDGVWETYGTPNMSLGNINEELRRALRGLFLAVGIAYTIAEDGNYIPMAPTDLDLVDLRHFVDRFRVLYDNAFRTQREGVFGGGRKGVRVNCKGDQFVLDYPQFEKARLPPTIDRPEATVEGVHWPQPAAWKIGLDLEAKRIPRGLSWCNRQVDIGVAAEENWPFLWLTTAFDETPLRDRKKSEENPDDRKDQGSFYIGHMDTSRELLPQHVQAMTEYFMSKAGASGHPRDFSGVMAYLNLLSREDFERFWRDWVRENAGGEEIPSPYDM